MTILFDRPLSIGVQRFIQHGLSTLDRVHTWGRLLRGLRGVQSLLHRVVLGRQVRTSWLNSRDGNCLGSLGLLGYSDIRLRLFEVQLKLA